DDAQNCGVCGRACFPGDACTSAVCPPVSADLARASVNPRDVDAVPATSEILYVDGAATGELWALGETAPRASGLGDVRRLDADAAAAFVTGTVDVGPARFDVIYQVNAVGPAPIELTRWDRAGASAPVLLDLAATATDVWFAVAGNTQLFRAVRGTNGQHGGEDLGELALSVAPAAATELLVGTGDATQGRVRGYDPATEQAGRAFLALGRSVDRVAYEPGRQIGFVASLVDGSVWWYDALDATRTPSLLWRTGQPTASMDLHADADGVYWTDLTAGLVMGLRYDTNPATWILYWYGGRPTGVTALGSSVYWADLDGGVFEAPK
ncbi:MAG TPA: hypothetical protein VIW03_05340, partial [Anaeromyxobacter sp.]